MTHPPIAALLLQHLPQPLRRVEPLWRDDTPELRAWLTDKAAQIHTFLTSSGGRSGIHFEAPLLFRLLELDALTPELDTALIHAWTFATPPELLTALTPHLLPLLQRLPDPRSQPLLTSLAHVAAPILLTAPPPWDLPTLRALPGLPLLLPDLLQQRLNAPQTPGAPRVTALLTALEALGLPAPLSDDLLPPLRDDLALLLQGRLPGAAPTLQRLLLDLPAPQRDDLLHHALRALYSSLPLPPAQAEDARRALLTFQRHAIPSLLAFITEGAHRSADPQHLRDLHPLHLLLLLTSPDDLPELLDLLPHLDNPEACALVAWTAALAADASLHHLLRCWERADTHQQLQLTAILAAQKTHQPTADTLQSLLSPNLSPEVSDALHSSLQRHDDEPLTLHDPAPLTRALAAQDDPLALPSLLTLWLDDPRLASMLAAHLAALRPRDLPRGTPEPVPFDVALRWLGPHRLDPALRQQLYDAPRAPNARALYAWLAARGAADLDLTLHLLTTASAATREHATEQLQQLDHLPEPLLDLLSHRKTSLRTTAAATLQRLGHSEAIPALRDVLAVEKNASVRAALQSAIDTLDPPEGAP